jgi:hypothetical protein
MRIVVVNHGRSMGLCKGPAGPTRTREAISLRRMGGTCDCQQPLVETIGDRMGAPRGGMLLGRRSYEGMLGQWNKVGGPSADGLNRATKYVASRNPPPSSSGRTRGF